MTIQSIYKIGPCTLPHLAVALDTPNELLSKNVCYVLGQLTGIVKDRKHYHKPLAALDAAISGNKYPASRPMYVVTRMKIDGNVNRAERMLLEDVQSKDIDVRVAALRHTEHFSSIADRIVPLLIKKLTDQEPRVIRTATNALWSLHRYHDIDVSAAIPMIAKQAEQQLKPYHLHGRLMRFLDDRWEELGETPEEDLPEADVLVKNFPIKDASFRSWMMKRLDRGLGIDDGIAASWVIKAHGAAGMAIIDIEFAGRSPAGKVLLMKGMQHLPYLESYELLLRAMTDRETVKWNIPRGTKGSEPMPPGSIPLRVCDEAFKHLRWRLLDWKPLSTAVGRRSMYPRLKIVERDKLIATMKTVWEMQGNQLLLPSYKMAQTGRGTRAQKLGTAELKRVRESVLEADIVSGAKRDPSGVPRRYLIIPERRRP